MAKLTYLQMINRILARINQAQITDVATVTAGSHADIIANLLNEAQNELWTEVNWYSLYATRKFNTVVYSASTIAFNDADPDTITDSASGLGNFQDGMQILASGSASNNGTYTTETAVAGTLTLQDADALTAEAVGESVSITAITYPVASDWGRTIDMMDTTGNRMLIEDVTRAMDEVDPDADYTGNPTHFAIQGRSYRFSPIPAGVYSIRERYWKQPTALSVNASTSDLPVETENCLIRWTLYNMLEYLNKFDAADRIRIEFERLLKRAKASNSKMIDKLHRFSGNQVSDGIHAPRFPSRYGVRYF